MEYGYMDLVTIQWFVVDLRIFVMDGIMPRGHQIERARRREQTIAIEWLSGIFAKCAIFPAKCWGAAARIFSTLVVMASNIAPNALLDFLLYWVDRLSKTE